MQTTTQQHLTAWNTGNHYTEHGQRIAACLVGNVIAFVDIDRGIDGAIDVGNVIEFFSSYRDIQREVRVSYVNGDGYGYSLPGEYEERLALRDALVAAAQKAPSHTAR